METTMAFAITFDELSRTDNEENNDMTQLCKDFRDALAQRNYERCEYDAMMAMMEDPNSAQLHNLLGVLAETKGDHALAMRHFRAAWAMDPTFLPARHNLELTGTFFAKGALALEDADCPEKVEKPASCHIEYDEHGVGHVVSNYRLERDKYGIGRFVRR